MSRRRAGGRSGERSANERRRGGRIAASSRSRGSSSKCREVYFVYRHPRDIAKGVIRLPGGVTIYPSYVREDFSVVGGDSVSLDGVVGVPNMRFLGLSSLSGLRPGTRGVGRGGGGPGRFGRLSVGGVPTPRGVGTHLSRCVIKRRCTGGTVSITICGRCGHMTAKAVSRVRVRGSGVLVVKPAKYNGACLIGALTGLLSIPLTVASTASLARTKCVNSSVRDIISGLLTTTSGSIRHTRRKVVFVSRVSGVTGGGASDRESIDNRSIRRKVLGLLRKDRIRIPMNTGDGGTVIPLAAIGAGGVLFVYKNTFPSLRSVVGRHLRGGASVKFGTRLGSAIRRSRRLLSGIAVRSLEGFNVVPRFLKHLPVMFALGKLSGRVLIGVLGRPGGTVLGRCRGLLTLSRIGLRFSSDTLRTVTRGTVRGSAKTETLHTVVRRFVLSVVCRVPGSSGVKRMAVAETCVRNANKPIVRLENRTMPELSKWDRVLRERILFGGLGAS